MIFEEDYDVQEVYRYKTNSARETSSTNKKKNKNIIQHLDHSSEH